jgi:5-methyltetrahydropteroyltriglutamate--homocysteine methyltransferase
LLQARAAYEQGDLTDEQLHQVEDTAVLQALALQRQAGLDVITDGEYRRAEFRSVFDQAVEGLVQGTAPVRPGQSPETVQPALLIGAKVRQVRRMTAHESSFLQQHAAAPFKIAIPAVSQIVSSYWQGSCRLRSGTHTPGPAPSDRRPGYSPGVRAAASGRY